MNELKPKSGKGICICLNWYALVGEIGLRLDVHVIGTVDHPRVKVGSREVLILAGEVPCCQNSSSHVLICFQCDNQHKIPVALE